MILQFTEPEITILLMSINYRKYFYSFINEGEYWQLYDSF